MTVGELRQILLTFDDNLVIMVNDLREDQLMNIENVIVTNDNSEVIIELEYPY